MTDKPGTGELSPATFIEIRFADGKTLRAENGAAAGIWRWLMGCETMALVHGSRYEGPALEVISEGAECTGELSGAAQFQEFVTQRTREIVSGGATQPATPHEEKLLLLRTIVELSYCHSAETVSLVESAEGRAIIEAGMKLLDMEDLSEESQAEAKRKIIAGSTPKSS